MKSAALRPTHSQVRQSIVDYLWAIGAYPLPVIGGLGQRRGSPDIVAAIPNPDGGPAIWLAVEIKVGRDTLRTTQQEQRECIERVGGLYVLAGEDGARDVERVLVAEGLALPALL